jgi:hypothetical protein
MRIATFYPDDGPRVDVMIQVPRPLAGAQYVVTSDDAVLTFDRATSALRTAMFWAGVDEHTGSRPTVQRVATFHPPTSPLGGPEIAVTAEIDSVRGSMVHVVAEYDDRVVFDGLARAIAVAARWAGYDLNAEGVT